MDEEGLDDLLDSVERDLRRKPTASSCCSSSCRSSGSRREQPAEERSQLAREVDDLLEHTREKEEEEEEVGPSTPPTTFGSDAAKASGNDRHKCTQVRLGGSLTSMGCHTPAKQRCCDRLFCLECDTRVVSFDDRRWHPTADYLFLRNNAPDRWRLEAKLVPSPSAGWRAYCCQCKLVSVSGGEARPVASCSDQAKGSAAETIKWICAKH